jgi:hypothetical protein
LTRGEALEIQKFSLVDINSFAAVYILFAITYAQDYRQDYPGNAMTGKGNSIKSAELLGIMDQVIRLANSL